MEAIVITIITVGFVGLLGFMWISIFRGTGEKSKENPSSGTFMVNGSQPWLSNVFQSPEEINNHEPTTISALHHPDHGEMKGKIVLVSKDKITPLSPSEDKPEDSSEG